MASITTKRGLTSLRNILDTKGRKRWRHCLGVGLTKLQYIKGKVFAFLAGVSIPGLRSDCSQNVYAYSQSVLGPERKA